MIIQSHDKSSRKSHASAISFQNGDMPYVCEIKDIETKIEEKNNMSGSGDNGTC